MLTYYSGGINNLGQINIPNLTIIMSQINMLTGQSEPNATNAFESKSDLNKYDSLSALSSPSFLPAELASSNK